MPPEALCGSHKHAMCARKLLGGRVHIWTGEEQHNKPGEKLLVTRASLLVARSYSAFFCVTKYELSFGMIKLSN